jgi:hypothetical protein
MRLDEGGGCLDKSTLARFRFSSPELLFFMSRKLILWVLDSPGTSGGPEGAPTGRFEHSDRQEESYDDRAGDPKLKDEGCDASHYCSESSAACLSE